MKRTILGFSILMSCSFAIAQEPGWRDKMRAVSEALSQVVPYLYPNADKDVKGLSEKVKRLNEAAQKLDIKKDHMMKAGDNDPGLIFLAESFQEDVARAQQALNAGHADYARHTLKSSTAYCIACHTRTSAGTQFPLLGAFSEALKNAPWVDRLEFEAASRQFDSVYDQVMTELKKKKCDSLSALDLERGVRLALSIAIRVKQDPAKTMKIAEAVRASQCTNTPLKAAAKDWVAEVKTWQKEKPAKLTSAGAVLDEGRRLIRKADFSPSKGHDEIYFLRATSVLHELLRNYPSSSEVPEALYLIGVSYSPLQDLGLWNLQEKYFQACILAAPHTDLAEKCYTRFEQSIVLGYSGSSGTHIPGEMQLQLQQLKSKAKKTKESL